MRAAAIKNQAIQYLALDVHQQRLWRRCATSRNDPDAGHGAIEASAILGWVRGLDERVHVAFEEGAQAQWLHDLLEGHAKRVVVCNVRGRRETNNKSDGIDADGLSEMLLAAAAGCCLVRR